jgi:hypothetical protein
MAAIGTAAVAAGKKLYDMANDAAAAGDEIDKASQRIGLLIRNRFLPWGGKHVKLSCFCAHGGGLLRWRERL